MGLRGPAPIPIEIKRARGNPGKRKLPENAPSARLTGDLYRPDDLDPGAIEEWSRLVPILHEQGILSDENYLVVAQICRIESRRTAAQREINEAGMVVEGPGGAADPRIHPLLKVAQACEDQLRPLYREVGITPSSRGGVTAIAKESHTNPFAQFGS